MWRGAISSQITSVFQCRCDREGEEEKEEGKTGGKCRKTGSVSPSQSLALRREFSQVGKISADDTVVKMKTPQRLVDVTVIDS